jgi:hypothetical protein
VAGIVAKAKHKEFFSPGVVLGFCYQTSPVIVDDGTGAQWERSNDYTPMAIPGCLAPHRWLDESTSLYDRFGAGMTLLVLAPDRYDDIAAARDEAQDSGTPLTILTLPREDLRAAYEEPLALIRPDQHVAWRGKSWPRGTGLLKHVTGRADQTV